MADLRVRLQEAQKMTADARLVLEGLLGQVADLRAEMEEIAHGPPGDEAVSALSETPPALPAEALYSGSSPIEITDELLLPEPLPEPGDPDDGGTSS